MSLKISSYQVELTQEFAKQYNKLVRKNKTLKIRIDNALERLMSDPFYPGLRTHRVNTKNWGTKYSSSVTGDLRIIWDFSRDATIILVLTLGGHSGGSKVYK